MSPHHYQLLHLKAFFAMSCLELLTSFLEPDRCGMSLCAKPSILLIGISADGNEHEVRQVDYPKERFCAKLECDH
jgi:hypothetical protein